MRSNLAKNLICGLLAATMIVPPVSVQAEVADPQNPLGLGVGVTPEGRWRSENGDSRYEVELCGSDGTALCGRLIWIRPKDRNRRNVQYVGSWVVQEIPRTRPAEWRGTLNVYGDEYGGSVKMVSMNELQMTGCLLIFCETYSFIRLRYPDGSPTGLNLPGPENAE